MLVANAGKGVLLCLLLLLPGLGAAAKDNRAPAPQPFGLVLGSTTEAQAGAICAAENATATGRGHVDARPASQGDNDPEGLPMTRAVLVDVAGLPVAGVESTRFGFFDDRLYLLQYRFPAQHDARGLLQQLQVKYGAPVETPGLAATYVWRFQGVTLTLRDELMGPDTLAFVHEQLQKDLGEASQALYRDFISQKADSQRGF